MCQTSLSGRGYAELVRQSKNIGLMWLMTTTHWLMCIMHSTIKEHSKRMTKCVSWETGTHQADRMPYCLQQCNQTS